MNDEKTLDLTKFSLPDPSESMGECLPQLPDDLLEKIFEKLFLSLMNVVTLFRCPTCDRTRAGVLSNRLIKTIFKILLVSKHWAVLVHNTLLKINLSLSVISLTLREVPLSAIALLPTVCFSPTPGDLSSEKCSRWFNLDRFDAVSCLTITLSSPQSRDDRKRLQHWVNHGFKHLKHVQLNAMAEHFLGKLGPMFREKTLETFKSTICDRHAHPRFKGIAHNIWPLNGSEHSLKTFELRTNKPSVRLTGISERNFPDLSTFSSLENVRLDLLSTENDQQSDPVPDPFPEDPEKHSNRFPFYSLVRSRALRTLQLTSRGFDFSLIWKIKSLKHFSLIIVERPSYSSQDFNLDFEVDHDLASLSPFAWSMIQLDRAARKVINLESFELCLFNLYGHRVAENLLRVAHKCQERTGIHVILQDLQTKFP